MAFAGPAANFALLLIAALLIRVGIEWHVLTAPYSISFSRVVTATDPGVFDLVAEILSVFFSLNLLLGIFNLLPIPPLDGASLPLIALPTGAAQKYFDVLRSPVLQIVGFLIISRGFGPYFRPILEFAVGLLHPGVSYR
jgi:Zn-dependent protease